VLYALSALGGTFTIVEAVGRQQGWDVTGIPQVKAPLALLVSAAAVGVLVTQSGCGPSGVIGASGSHAISRRT
jgi:hypothetical protein